ncbi:DUF968 domain-containing protein [Raoultella terrigena]|uniref:DUF968 domain-containing protein n=1 Tax=Raoultella terrigena TaxID=577 RepID=UPI001F1662EE|nr:DUF968 domain-containing protein [Raoultella terrigena]
MRALLKVDIARHLGVVLLKPGGELMPLFGKGRVLVELPPEYMDALPSGRLADARQPLRDDKELKSFFMNERVIAAAGGVNALEAWLERTVKHCQWPHSTYHHPELVNFRHDPGAIRACWHCDNDLRNQTTQTLDNLVIPNTADWIIDTALIYLGYNKERMLSLAELCWWAVCEGIGSEITEEMARRSLKLKSEGFQSVYRESDIVPSVPATSILQAKLPTAGVVQQCRPSENEQALLEQPKVLALTVDPESPESFMLKPKRRRWVNKTYTDWVKRQPCECCRRPADDPHHVIGYGMGGTATKAHDLFVIPLCRECHDELHADVNAFEEKNGSQLQLLFRFLDRAIAIGVIVKA